MNKILNGRLVPLSAEEQTVYDARMAAHAAAALPNIKAEAVAATKAEAARRISLLSGGSALELRLLRWAAQINSMRGTSHPYPDALPEPWASRETAMMQQGAAIEAVASASNAIEGDIAALDTTSAVQTWIAALPTDSRWPE